MGEQAEKVFDKKFLKTDRAKEELPKEKAEAFSQVLGKFFDNEDYKKEQKARVPDYEAVKGQVANNPKEYFLTESIVEIDRQADRQYEWASRMNRRADAVGETFGLSSSRKKAYKLKGEGAKKFKEAMATLKTKIGTKKPMEYMFPPEMLTKDGLIDFAKLEKDEPEIVLYQNHMDYLKPIVENFMPVAAAVTEKGVGALFGETTPEEMVDAFGKMDKDEFLKAYLKDVTMKNSASVLTKNAKARKNVTEGALFMRDFYRTEKPNADGKITKADVLKEIWEEMGKSKMIEGPLPPLDDELLAMLADKPAGNGIIHPWGTADSLYKSEAIDSFGNKYLLGIFETQEECSEAFKAWNAEYMQAKEDMKSEFEAYSKREEARMETDTSARDRILAVLDESRAKLNR